MYLAVLGVQRSMRLRQHQAHTAHELRAAAQLLVMCCLLWRAVCCWRALQRGVRVDEPRSPLADDIDVHLPHHNATLKQLVQQVEVVAVALAMAGRLVDGQKGDAVARVRHCNTRGSCAVA